MFYNKKLKLASARCSEIPGYMQSRHSKPILQRKLEANISFIVISLISKTKQNKTK